jgi:Na+/H+ antiporter NhaD/arsenite permease-like protein
MPVLLAASVPLLAVVPFVLLLLGIAVLPLAAGHWWEHNRNKGIVAGLLALPILIWCWTSMEHGVHVLGHTLEEYVQFICLLGSLFAISGGICLDGDLRPSTRVNATFLGIGAVLANLIGTTGAAMVLVRPYLRANSRRCHIVHSAVFFVFVVCNTGGLLTPLGDPPLFLGYLKGVPPLWTLNLWMEWLGVNLLVILLYIILDSRLSRREDPAVLRGPATPVPLSLSGRINLLFLLGVVLLVAFKAPFPWAQFAMAGLVILSLSLTPRGLRARNGFVWGPIVEVAVLFIGIFITMIPALEMLKIKGPEMGVTTPMAFFWYTGILSSFLDNAPTYLTFFTLAQALGLTENLVNPVGIPYDILAAISCGAVFMGANTYIGNGPNFMVKAIAESQRVRMPSFFGYMAWSGAILLPAFVVTSLIYFR